MYVVFCLRVKCVSLNGGSVDLIELKFFRLEKVFENYIRIWKL